MARATAIVALGLAHGFLCRTVGQAQAQDFNRRGHGIGRVHATAAAGAGYGGALDLQHFGVRDLSGDAAAHGLENGDDIAPPGARANGAPVYEHGRPIQAGNGHGAAGHIFIATTDGHETIEAFGANHRLDGVGDDLARYQGIAHPGRSHRDAIGHGNGIEGYALAPGGIGASGYLPGQFADMHVAGREV